MRRFGAALTLGTVTILPVLTDPLATDVSIVCEQLSAALGWRVDFSQTDDHSNESSVPIWSEPVKLDDPSHGRLRLNHAPASCVRAELPVAVATAQAVSVLISRLRTALHSLETRSREVSTLMELGHPDQTHEGVSTRLERLLAAAVDLTGFWGAAFFLIDPVIESLRLRSSWRIDPALIVQPRRSLAAPTPDAQALRHGAILLNRQNDHAATWLPEGCTVAIGVPVQSAEGPLGTLWCYERRQCYVSRHCITALKSVAAQIARALERTVLLRESAVRKRLRNELKAASRHQNICQTFPVHVHAGIDVAMRAASASELSGDLCEVCPLDSSRTFLALGDAVGHSIPAAMVMAVARGALRALLHDGETSDWQPCELIRRINRTLCSLTSAEQFMSVVAGVIDQRECTLTYCNAGHPPPWLLRRGERKSLKSHGMLCGVLTQAVYEQSVVTIEPGDLLVFFSDGISEALSPQRQLFRVDGVLDALGHSTWESADAAADAIWQRMTEHVGHTDPSDDQTLLVIKVREARAELPLTC